MEKNTELAYDFGCARSIKSLKFFRGVLRMFSIKKFSCDAKILATIDVDKYTFDEFLIMTGDFEIVDSNNGCWLKCIRNDVAVLYKKLKGNCEQFSKTYSNWEDDYFDIFKGLTFSLRYTILKEI
jgi:hypothetical protein